jgi:hypothetical protein
MAGVIGGRYGRVDFANKENPMAYETEYEDELEQELEDELEQELEDESEDEDEYESEDESEDESEYEDESEEEYEDEDEYEDEEETAGSPVRKVYADAMMEHLGALAAESESEEEAAEHFLPLIGMAASKLLPLAAKAIRPALKRGLPRVIKAVHRVAPKLTRSVGRIARVLHRRPAARRLLRTVPTIARRTIHSIARQAAHGRPITGRAAIRTLARQARRVLRSPHHRRHALHRNLRMDRRFHRRIGRGVVHPHLRHPHLRHHRLVRRVRVPLGGGVAGVRRAGTVRRPGHAAGTCACGRPVTPNYCRCCGQMVR